MPIKPIKRFKVAPEPKSNTGNVVYFRAADLASRYGVHVITIFKWAASRNLPKPVKLGPNTTAWRSDTIERWEAERTGAEAE